MSLPPQRKKTKERLRGVSRNASFRY